MNLFHIHLITGLLAGKNVKLVNNTTEWFSGKREKTFFTLLQQNMLKLKEKSEGRNRS